MKTYLAAATAIFAEGLYIFSTAGTADMIFIVFNIVGLLSWLLLGWLIHLCQQRYSSRSMLFTWVQPVTTAFLVFCGVAALRMIANLWVTFDSSAKIFQAWAFVLDSIVLATACGYASVYYRRIPGFLDRIAKHQVNSRRFDTLTDAAVDGIIEIDVESNIWYANPAAALIFGFADCKDMLGENMTDLMPVEYRAMHNAGVARFVETKKGPIVGNRKPTRIPGLRTDGKIIQIDLTVSYYMLNDSIRFCAILRDVEETATNGAAVEVPATCPFKGE